MITADRLKARLDELKGQQQAALSTADACEGAIQDCLYWLQFLAKEENAAADGDAATPKE